MSVISPTLSLGATLPIGWGYHGCWTDYDRRKLSGPSYVDGENMTPASCVAFCNDKKYPFAGVEFGQECYCGYVIGAGSEQKNDTECTFTCPGALDEACGAGFRLNVFYNGLLDYAHTNPGPPGTSRIGCLTDDVYARALSVFQASEDGLTVAQCTSSCKAAGHTLAGLEFGRECFCGDSIDNNATTTEEGCDMPCTGDRTEFCGGATRLDLYILNATSISPTSTIPATQICNPTSTAAAKQLIANGGFEHGLANWTVAAYDPDRAPFDIGLTNDALEGCFALSIVPKNGSNGQGQHFYAYTTLANLQPSSQYRVSLAIGHPDVVDAQGSDPRYTVRLSDSALGSGSVCGFKYSPCQLIGPNNSKYEIVNMTLTADSYTEVLTIYLSWYNGNFDTPFYLDRITVEPLFGAAFTSMAASDSSLQLSTATSLAAMTIVSSSTAKTTLTTMTSAVDVKVSESSKEVSLPSISGVPGVLAPSASSTFQACPRSLPKDEWHNETRPDITNKSLSNSGFESGFVNWSFSSEGGAFDITLTNQSIEGCLAASIKPTSPHNGTDRSLTVQTRMTNLNSSHEWYEMAIYVGHTNTNTTADNGLSPSIRISYRNEVSGDFSRIGGLCGFNRTPTYNEEGWPCEYMGADGTVWAQYGMDTRLFLSGERLTNGTEMDIELKFVWPEGASEVPVLMDGMRIWEIEWGSISR